MLSYQQGRAHNWDECGVCNPYLRFISCAHSNPQKLRHIYESNSNPNRRVPSCWHPLSASQIQLVLVQHSNEIGRQVDSTKDAWVASTCIFNSGRIAFSLSWCSGQQLPRPYSLGCQNHRSSRSDGLSCRSSRSSDQFVLWDPTISSLLARSWRGWKRTGWAFTCLHLTSASEDFIQRHYTERWQRTWWEICDHKNQPSLMKQGASRKQQERQNERKVQVNQKTHCEKSLFIQAQYHSLINVV